jgi:hypothetical protein
MHVQGLNLALDPLGMPSEKVTLLTGSSPPDDPVGLIDAHIFDPDTHRPQAR